MDSQGGTSRLSAGAGLLLQTGASLIVLVALLALMESLSAVVLRHFPKVGDLALPAGQDFVLDTLRYHDWNPLPLAIDRGLLWRNEPNVRKTLPVNPERLDHAGLWTFANDGNGFRGTPFAKGRPADAFRILLVGDSITFGYNVDQSDVFAVGLRRHLTKRHPGLPVEVVNAGVAGWSWVQGLRFLEREGVALDPQVVVIGHGTNDRFFRVIVTDFERLPAPNSPMERARRSIERLVGRTRTYRLLQRLVVQRARRRNEPSKACRRQIEASGRCRRLALSDISRAVQAVARLCAGRGIDLVVANYDFIGTDAVDGVRAGVQATGTAHVDFVERLETLQTRLQDERATALHLMRTGTRPNTGVTRGVLLRTYAPDGDGPFGAVGGAYYNLDAFSFDVPLTDDGTGGDEHAGDHVWSGWVRPPPDVTRLQYQFTRGGASEFRPLPPVPASTGYRLATVGTAAMGPIEQFAQLDYMAERTHPDAAGHAVIAKDLAKIVEDLPAFQRALRRSDPSARR